MSDPLNYTAINPFRLNEVNGYTCSTFADMDSDIDFDALLSNSNGNTLFLGTRYRKRSAKERWDIGNPKLIWNNFYG